MKIKQRFTRRKAIIERIIDDDYSGGPVLLEELRWKVLTEQYGRGFVEMTDAKMKSFARTIRVHCPRLKSHKIPVANSPAGLIARAALYRCESREIINHFLAADNPSAFLNIGYPDHWDYRQGEFGMRIWNEARRRYRKRLPRVTVGCYFRTRADRFTGARCFQRRCFGQEDYSQVAQAHRDSKVRNGGRK
jgi:hypothetical protein